MKCVTCKTELSEDASYKMYIPFTNGKARQEQRRVCFWCHFFYEYLTGDPGRIDKCQ